MITLPTSPAHAAGSASQGFSYGIDEAGRGSLAGPVVAAIVLFPPTVDWRRLKGLNDSKKLTEQKRKALLPHIMAEAAAYGVGLSWQKEIDEINIVNATFRAMCRAIIAMHINFSPLPSGILHIDGNLLIRPDAWQDCSGKAASQWHTHYFPRLTACPPHSEEIPPMPAPDHKQAYAAIERLKNAPTEPHGAPSPPFPFTGQEAIIGGDGKVPSISAASILAKTRRDHIMSQLDKYAPRYGFAKHKGYGTLQHRQSILQHGPSNLHRITFIKTLSEPRQQLLLLQ